jgi:multidrug efflux pump subunit AcrA (membrane-fusion protein)
VARIVLDNADGTWRPGMFADVRLTAELAPSAVLVPDSAVLRSGERNTVFVALPGGAFEPREVKLGSHTDDYRYEVLSGLAEGERVVISGQFMLDSESQLREAIQKMLK